MVKKLMILASMALAIGAIAPLAAQASPNHQWTVGGNKLTENKTIEGAGTAKFEGELGGVECGVDVSIEFTSGKGASAHVKKFDITLATCKRLGLLAVVCSSITEAKAQNLPWTITGTTPNTGDVTGVKIHNTFSDGGLCPKEINLEEGGGTSGVTITGAEGNPSNKFNFGGELESTTGPVEATGSVTLAGGVKVGLTE